MMKLKELMDRRISGNGVVALGLIAVGVLGSAAAAGVFSTESFSSGFEIENPEWGSTHEHHLALGAFNSHGGTRQLIGVEVITTLSSDTYFEWNGNPTSEVEAAQVTWHTTFSASLNGNRVFPSPGFDESVYQWTGGFGVITPAFVGGSSAMLLGNGIQTEDLSSDAAYLAQFYGTGFMDIATDLNIGDFDVHAHPETSGVPGPYVFNPDLFTVMRMDRFYGVVQLSYHYVEVPSPGVMGLFGLSTLGLARRRR